MFGPWFTLPVPCGHISCSFKLNFSIPTFLRECGVIGARDGRSQSPTRIVKGEVSPWPTISHWAAQERMNK
ncbi:hypothetical protein E2C01_003070 [Portunus trituberculatus]|uniref:Uncharacterized protein n=1 Tax=Portunus trituberculatus TaxID=210409 RepID=A0A5B7CP79_PORTR|nr:hypothetical protein [Portunus trituberculatus]